MKALSNVLLGEGKSTFNANARTLLEYGRLHRSLHYGLS